MEKWRSIAAGMSCLSMLFATGAVTVSASDEITEIPEQSIVYWSMWEEDEPQADVIREAAEAYEEATGISVEIQWKGRGIRSGRGWTYRTGYPGYLGETDQSMP